MKKFIFLGYLILSVQVAQGQAQKLEIQLEEIGKNEGLFYEYFQGKTSFSINASPKKPFRIQSGAGKVKIIPGKSNRIEVDAEILILASNYKKAIKYLERDLRLSLKDRGEYFELLSNFNYQKETRRGESFNPFDFIKTPDRKVNLVISVPKKMKLKIVDNSGDLVLSYLHNDIDIDDGSGFIKIKHTTGNITINDRSGNIYLADINVKKGNHYVTINDASGNIEINDLKAELKIDDDSGDIYIQNVVGDVEVDDYSGALKMRDIDGNIQIKDTSGDISTKRVTGTATYTDGAGDIFISDMRSDVFVKHAGAGDVYLQNVEGNIRGDIE